MPVGRASSGSISTDADAAFAIGSKAFSYGDQSFTLGHWVEADVSETFNYVFGSGTTSDNLVNDISNSIMIGMDSDEPTMFIEGAGGSGLGNVGIGTTTPDAILHLADEATVNTTLIIESGGANSRYLQFQEAGGNSAYIRQYSNDLFEIRNEETNADINVNVSIGGTQTSVLNIDGGTGFVGVNTTSPSAHLDVRADAAGTEEEIARFRVSDATGPEYFRIMNRSTTATEYAPWIEGSVDDQDNAALEITGRIQANANGGTNPVLEFNASHITAATAITRPLFRWSSNTVNSLMEMDENGNLGIRTTDPNGALHVEADDETDTRDIVAHFGLDGVTASQNYFQILNETDEDGEFGTQLKAKTTTHDDRPVMMIKAVAAANSTSSTTSIMQFDSRYDGTGTNPRALFSWTENNNGATRMIMDAGGNVGIGTNTPSGRLDVSGSLFANLNTGGLANDVHINGSGELVDATGSSENLKENISDLEFDAEQFLSLRPVTFDWKPAQGGDSDIGLIAEEVADVFPQLGVYGYGRTYLETGEILRDSMNLPIVDSSQWKVNGVRYSKIPVYLLSIVQNQQQRINSLEEQFEHLSETISNCCITSEQFRFAEDQTTASINEVEEEFILLQNDPNPFTDYSDIRYEAKDCERCEIVISDFNGRIVKRIQTNGPMGTIRVYGSDIGTGFYVYSLVNNGQIIKSSRMISSNQ